MAAKKLYRHSIRVKGRMAFPIDMLRYDACYPQASVDVEEINISQDRSITRYFEVTLEKQATTIANVWTKERWLSFGYETINEHIY